MTDERERDDVGRLVIITGLPGSGKTTLATELASVMPALRMCPDDWMMSSGIDLWDSAARSRIEQFQLALSLGLLSEGHNVVIEWGVWTRRERDELRDAARAVGASVELRYVTADSDELWRRIVGRDLEGDGARVRSGETSSMRGRRPTRCPTQKRCRPMTLRSLSDPAWTTTGYAGDPSGAFRDALRGRPAVPTLTGNLWALPHPGMSVR